MRDFLLNNRRFFLIVTFLIVTFFGATILIQHTGIYVSPDETANAYFSELFSDAGTFFSYNPLSESLGDVLYPRSMISLDGRLLPSGFIGLPVLYGSLAAFVGVLFVPWFTLIISVLAVVSWYFTTKKLFPKRVAFLATLLLATHPAWWYYTARSLMPNSLFVSLVLLAIFFLVVRPFKMLRNGYKIKQKRWKFLNKVQKKLLRWWVPFVDLVLSAGLFGAAVFVRPSEVFWMAAAALCVLVVYWKKEHWKASVLFLLIFIIALLPMLHFHEMFYGGALKTGYNAGESAAVSVGVAEEVVSTATDAQLAWYTFLEIPIIKAVFPFGVHPRNALQHMGWYLVSLFWWLSLLAIPGFFLLFSRRKKMKSTRARHRTYALVFLVVLGWLGVMYGSWSFHDNPDPLAITIANSYVRYWLPLYVMSTPLIAYSIHWLAKKATVDGAKNVAIVGLMSACVVLNSYAVFWQGDDALFTMSAMLQDSLEIRASVLEIVPEQGVIVVDRADKIFFPYRTVRYPLRDETTYQLLPVLLETSPVYYYGITFPQEDLDFLNQKKLPELGVRVEQKEIFGEESLYQFFAL
jgi:hypothetical protein